MLSSTRDRWVLKKLEQLSSLQSQVRTIWLRDKLRKQDFHEDMKKDFESFTDTIKTTSEVWTKTMMLISKENNRALENLNNKFLEILNGRGILASYLMSPLSKINNPANINQFKLVDDPNSQGVINLLKNKTIPVTLYNNLLTIRDTDKKVSITRRSFQNDD